MTFDVSASDPENNLWKINVSYEGGAQGRHSAVEYDHSSTTSFNFISESPQLFYVSVLCVFSNSKLISNCINQVPLNDPSIELHTMRIYHYWLMR